MIVIGGLILSYLLLNRERMLTTVDRCDYPLSDMEKLGVVTIIVPTLNEAATIKQVLVDLENQNVRVAYPERFQVIVADSSDDETKEIASQFDADIITVPLGKLTAIDTAIKYARGNIIVAADADSRYGCNFLNLLLEHFQDPSIVGVTGTGIYGKYPFLGVLRETAATIVPRMMGRGCAYRKEAYYTIGGFDLTIDQTSSRQMLLKKSLASGGDWRK